MKDPCITPRPAADLVRKILIEHGYSVQGAGLLVCHITTEWDYINESKYSSGVLMYPNHPTVREDLSIQGCDEGFEEVTDANYQQVADELSQAVQDVVDGVEEPKWVLQ